MNLKLAGVVFVPIGLFLVILGAIFLPISINDYNQAVSNAAMIPPPTCTTVGLGKSHAQTTCPMTFAVAETLIAESALALGIGVTALIGGFLLLGRKAITQGDTHSGIIH